MQALTHDKKMLNLRLTYVVFIKQRSVSVCVSVWRLIIVAADESWPLDRRCVKKTGKLEALVML